VSDNRRWWGLGVLLLPVLLVSMDSSVLFLAMPMVTDGLDPSPTQTLWILDSYSFVIAGLLITMGSLGDRVGRRRLLLMGATVFGIGSVVAAFSVSPTVLIVARALMGLGGATLLPSSLSLITTMFPDLRERSRAIGVWTAAFSGGTAIGPLVGGVLLHQYWWGSVFLINVPVLAALLLAGPLVLPEFANPSDAAFDLRGVALSISGILASVYAIKHLALNGVDAPSIVIGVVGLAIIALFARHCTRAPNPLVDPSLMRNRQFTVAIATSLTSMMALSATAYLGNTYLQSVTGREPLSAALMGIPMAITVCAFSLGSARIVRLIGARRAFIGSLLTCVVGLVVMLRIGVDGGPWAYLIGSAIAGIGYGLSFSLVSDVAVGSVPTERAGAATGVSETSFELGQALGLALLGSLAAVVFSRVMTTDGAAFRGTLGDAVTAAGGDAALIETAKSAYVTGVHAALGTAAVILAVMAVVATVVLPQKSNAASAE